MSLKPRGLMFFPHRNRGENESTSSINNSFPIELISNILWIKHYKFSKFSLASTSSLSFDSQLCLSTPLTESPSPPNGYQRVSQPGRLLSASSQEAETWALLV